MHANRIQLQVQSPQSPHIIRKAFPAEQGSYYRKKKCQTKSEILIRFYGGFCLGNARARFVQRTQNQIQNHIQMTTPQKVLQPAGIVQQGHVRFQTPVRAARAQNPTVRQKTPSARTPSARARAPINVKPTINIGQQQLTPIPSVMNTPRQRLAINRLSSPNQVVQAPSPIISVATPKHVVTTPARVTNIVRPSVSSNFNKTSPANTQTHIQNTASTSNTTTTTEDLEDSIQAATITKQPAVQQTDNYTIVQANQVMQQQQQHNTEPNDNRIVTLQTGTQMSVAEYKQRNPPQAVAGRQVTGIKQMNRPIVQSRQPRFAAPTTVRLQRPVMVCSEIQK